MWTQRNTSMRQKPDAIYNKKTYAGQQCHIKICHQHLFFILQNTYRFEIKIITRRFTLNFTKKLTWSSYIYCMIHSVLILTLEQFMPSCSRMPATFVSMNNFLICIFTEQWRRHWFKTTSALASQNVPTKVNQRLILRSVTIKFEIISNIDLYFIHHFVKIVSFLNFILWNRCKNLPSAWWIHSHNLTEKHVKVR